VIKVEVLESHADIEIDLEDGGPYQNEYAVLVVAATRQVASMLKVEPAYLLEKVLELVRAQDKEKILQ
jgi:hypothetical protein